MDVKETDKENAKINPSLSSVTASDLDVHDSYLFEFIQEAFVYFGKMGYTCDSSDAFGAIATLRGGIDIKLFLKTVIVHNKDEEKSFSSDYDCFVSEYFNRMKKKKENEAERENRKRKHEQSRGQREEKIKKLKEKKEKLEQEKTVAKESPEAKKAKELEKKQKKIKGLDDVMSDAGMLKDFVGNIEKNIKPDHDALMKEIKNASKKALEKKNTAEIMKALQDRAKALKKISGDEIGKELAKTIQEIEVEQQQMAQEEARFQAEMQKIMKEQTKEHRPVFQKSGNHRAVVSKARGEHIPDKEFNKLTEKEKRDVCDFIRDNAKKFRTKLNRKIKTGKKHELDMAETIKKSCETNGIPLRLQYKKPVRQKSNLILILDVSGSCKNASEMMLVFMHAMKEVFPGGCRTYAFTDRLYDISKFFEMDDAESAAKEILKAIPRSGVYSNYNKPLKEFYEKHISEVTGDSYIYFIGDARNNKNASGEDYMKAIARKAKKAFWLNTENRGLWDKGDSIMNVYAKYMTRVVQVETPTELLGFLSI